MPMNNKLNVSEFLKRLGVVGDSQGHMPLLDELRLAITLGDFSDLVPPLGSPIGAVGDSHQSDIGSFNQWTLQCLAPGGLTVTSFQADSITEEFNVWISDTDPFANSLLVPHADLTSGQRTLSRFFKNGPNETAQVPGPAVNLNRVNWIVLQQGNWVAPGQFFNVESDQQNVEQQIALSWREYPGAINPGFQEPGIP